MFSVLVPFRFTSVAVTVGEKALGALAVAQPHIRASPRRRRHALPSPASRCSAGHRPSRTEVAETIPFHREPASPFQSARMRNVGVLKRTASGRATEFGARRVARGLAERSEASSEVAARGAERAGTSSGGRALKAKGRSAVGWGGCGSSAEAVGFDNRRRSRKLRRTSNVTLASLSDLRAGGLFAGRFEEDATAASVSTLSIYCRRASTLGRSPQRSCSGAG